MAVIAFANAMRIQSIIGNTSLVIESEMFGQPTLRAKWKSEYGARPEDIRGVAVEDYVARLSERLLPLAKQFHQMASEAIDGLRRQRQMPAVEVERAVPREIRLVAAERSSSAAIEQVPDALGATLVQTVARSRLPADCGEPSHRRSGVSARNRDARTAG
jgi:hypothetical protein